MNLRNSWTPVAVKVGEAVLCLGHLAFHLQAVNREPSGWFVEWSTRQSIFGGLTCNSWNLQFYILFCAISSRESCLIRFYSLPLHIPTSLLITFSCPEGEMIKTPQNLRPQKVFCHKKPFRADDKPTGTVASRLYNPVAGRVLETRWLMRLGSPDLLFNRWDAG